MVNILGLLVQKEEARSTLIGDWVPPQDPDADTSAILQSLRENPPVEALGNISMETIKESILKYSKRARDIKALSILGLHFGQYKSAARSNFLTDIPIIFYHVIGSTGFNTFRQKVGPQVIMLKVPRNLLIEKLLDILVQESYYNFP